MMQQQPQPWIGKAWTDILFILLPPFACLLVIMLFPALFQQTDGMSDAWWMLLVVLIDVAHVYSTLYRTYADGNAYKQHKTKLLLIPFCGFVAMVLVYNMSALLFWRLLAYIAVFHFIRQQYGFMRIYSRKDNSSVWQRRIDTLTIYAATIYPILYWHLSGDRNFHWMIDGDFIQLPVTKNARWCAGVVYTGIMLLYMCKESWVLLQTKQLNIPRNAVILGTALSWYFGIVYFNGDMAFTLLNVVSHGIPYMALIWLYGKKAVGNRSTATNTIMRWAFSRYGIVIFLGLIFLLAYIEEGLWDLTLWKEHSKLFRAFHWTDIRLDKTVLSLIVPLLALPQITHYIIDGFIWRVKKDDLKWSDSKASKGVQEEM